MATYLIRATSDPQSSNTTATYSVWIKRGTLGSDQCIWGGSYYSNDNLFQFKFLDSDKLSIYSRRGASTKANLTTAQVFRDTSAWYHVVIAIDTTQVTEANRIKCYVNGELATVTGSYPSVNENLYLDSGAGANYYIGRRGDNAEYFSGSMSHFHYVDGTALAPTVFGSTDSVTGEWNINTSPSYTVGAKGFFLLKDGNSVTDASANSNNFTITNGTLTKTEDNPSNVFASINNVLGTDVVGSTVNFSNGNTVAEDPSGSASGINPNFISTLGMPSKGKWYCELQPSSFSTGSGHSIGIYRTKGSTDDTGEGGLEGNGAKIRYIFADTSIYIIKYGTNDQTGLTSITSGQTVGMALDLDNGTLQYYVNGSTRANAITGINSANDGYDYFFHAGLESSSSGRYGKFSWNFGNGAFGSTQLTGTTYQDSQSRGIFKHQPPTNFLALCTRNLNV